MEQTMKLGTFHIPLSPQCNLSCTLLPFSINSRYALFAEDTKNRGNLVHYAFFDGDTPHTIVRNFQSVARNGLPNFPASFVWFNLPFTIGGEQNGTLAQLRGHLNLNKPMYVDVSGPGTSFTVDTEIAMQCSENGFIRISRKTDCLDVISQFSCTSTSPVLYTPQLPEEMVFVCFSRGQCGAGNCTNAVDDFVGCLGHGCCWDERASLCHDYQTTEAGDFVLASSFAYEFLAKSSGSNLREELRCVSLITSVKCKVTQISLKSWICS